MEGCIIQHEPEDTRTGRAKKATGRVEVNLLNRACAQELSTHFSVFEDAILPDVPSYPKHEYFALFCPRQMVQSTLFSVILITMFIRFTFFVIVV